MTFGATPAEAAAGRRSTIQRAITCVTVDVVESSTGGASDQLGLVTTLRSTTAVGCLTFRLRLRYVLVHVPESDRRTRWRARCTSYEYKLSVTEGHEILSYHWHPAGRSHVTVPHLHLGASAGTLMVELAKAHIETGFVTPVSLLRLVLGHLGVPARGVEHERILAQVDTVLRGVLPREP